MVSFGAQHCMLTWTLTQADRTSRLEAFEMWIWRRMEKKISWKDKTTNEEILHMVQEDRKTKHNMVP